MYSVYNGEKIGIKPSSPLWKTLAFCRWPWLKVLAFKAAYQVATMVSVSPGKQWWIKGQDPREGFNSVFRVDCYQDWLCAHKHTLIHLTQPVGSLSLYEAVSWAMMYFNFHCWKYFLVIQKRLINSSKNEMWKYFTWEFWFYGIYRYKYYMQYANKKNAYANIHKAFVSLYIHCLG